MKLLEISIKNFRSVSDIPVKIKFDKSDIIFLFGPNNSGKSSILKAYEKLVTARSKCEISDFNGYNKLNPIEISGVFEYSDADEDNFGKKGLSKWVDQNNKIKIRKIWSAPEIEGQKQTYDPSKGEYVDDGFGGIDQIFSNAAPSPIWIPAMQSTAELSKWASELMKKAVLKSMSAEEKESYNEAVIKVQDFQKRLTSGGVVEKYNSLANKRFSKIFPNLSIRIDVSEGNDFDLSAAIEKEFSVNIVDNLLSDKMQSISTQGHGVIRQAMFNILGMVKNNEQLEKFGEDESTKKFLILFEEPEIYLHPQKINSLRRSLYEICRNSPFQILCASHSPMLIDLSQPHVSMVRVFRNNVSKIVCHQVDETIFGYNEAQKTFLQMIQKFDPHVCEAFFSSHVVLVEGDTEALVYRIIIDRLSPDNEINVVNTGSKNNIPMFQEVLTHFRIPHTIIHDGDERYVYEGGKRILNKDGSYRVNSAWTLNQRIWSKVEESNSIQAGLSRRFVQIKNFEDCHNYHYDASLGKPLSAYLHFKNIDIGSNVIVCEYCSYIVGSKSPPETHDQAYVEKSITD